MDLLVKLYDLPDAHNLFCKLEKENITIRKPIGPEREFIYDWIKNNFGSQWAAESMKGFYRNPTGIYIAVHSKNDQSVLLGFAAYDATCKGFFGPTGVSETMRGKGIGKALLLSCLQAMKEEGYGYAVIGDASHIEFYQKCCGAVPIENSEPGVYKNMISK